MHLLVSLAERPEPIEVMLRRALDSFQTVVLFDLAVIFELDGADLKVHTAAGPLADQRVRRHRLLLERFPTIARVLETRRPVALRDHHHTSEGDPFDDLLALPHGHACMVVPLYAGDRTLGAMTFDRRVCEPYPPAVVELAGVFGQLLAVTMLHAEQSALLLRHRGILQELARTQQRESERGLDTPAHFANLRSPEMQRLVRQAQLVAETPVPVLVQGETGVGKELLARAIHAWSPRRDEAFVAVNCAAIPEALLESELFGHVRGAFTGANAARAGRFVTAGGGTLFLDEIGDLPLAAQSKLLRVLQEGTFEPVGSDRPVKVDVRIIAATHVDLEQAVADGRFREDLYFRLAVFPLHLPPLRERMEDLGQIAHDILVAIARRSGRGPWTLTPDALEALAREQWPGNVRQLHNALERATILVAHGPLDARAVLPEARGRRQVKTADEPLETLEAVERRHIVKVLSRCQGRLYGERGAAKVLGMKPTTLQSRMLKLGITRSDVPG
ncbi:MAG: sigma 54-interacting transcriptional regulator [Polyangiaceae bacterium]|nr:sigma 54-interacting transcriptional regulator [Polyangiaceae bacterium]